MVVQPHQAPTQPHRQPAAQRRPTPHRINSGPLPSSPRVDRPAQGRRRRRPGSPAKPQTTTLRRRLPGTARRPQRSAAHRLTEEQYTAHGRWLAVMRCSSAVLRAQRSRVRHEGGSGQDGHADEDARRDDVDLAAVPKNQDPRRDDRPPPMTVGELQGLRSAPASCASEALSPDCHQIATGMPRLRATLDRQRLCSSS